MFLKITNISFFLEDLLCCLMVQISGWLNIVDVTLCWHFKCSSSTVRSGDRKETRKHNGLAVRINTQVFRSSLHFALTFQNH